eukprot:5458311-Amphidinium_carterae.1
MELCRIQDIKVIGLQRTVGPLHDRIASLEQSIQAIRESGTAAEFRSYERYQRLNEHTSLINDTLAAHTNSIQRLGEEHRQ